MRTVRDAEGTHYVLLKESAESSLVRDPETGKQQYVANEDLEPVDGESPLLGAAREAGAPGADGCGPLASIRDERAHGLLVELHARGPLPVRALLAYDLCESDLHGILGELRAAGLVTERRMDGERGYALTKTAAEAVAAASE